MKKILLVLAIAVVFMSCGNGDKSSPASGTASPAASDSNVTSTTPPPKQDTNPIGIMMGDTTIGINDSLRKDSFKK